MSDKIFIQIEQEVIEATGQNLEYIQSWQSEFPASSFVTEETLLAKEEARASALSKLAALGLTKEEIAAL
jgi:hypothetical protein